MIFRGFHNYVCGFVTWPFLYHWSFLYKWPSDKANHSCEIPSKTNAFKLKDFLGPTLFGWHVASDWLHTFYSQAAFVRMHACIAAHVAYISYIAFPHY